MTNKEAEKDLQSDPRLATLLAVHLVSQVLDEAYIIAKAAQDSGQPWQYVSGLRKIKRCSLNETYDNKDPEVPPFFGINNNILNQINSNKTPSKITTSTPQKTLGFTNVNDHSLIGQGDEDFTGSNDESKSTSLLIAHLFDMSDVERDMLCDKPHLIQDNEDTNDVIINAMKKIMDSFVECALNSAFARDNSIEENRTKSSGDTMTSSYSLLTDAGTVGDAKGETSCLYNDDLQRDGNYSKQDIDNNEITNEHDIAAYEKAFLTLNRDYEQYSDDEEPVLQDPKALPLQEIELMAVGSSGDNHPLAKEMKTQEFAAVSGVSTSVLGSKKSSLVQRCRTQGARLLSCLRGWWWRRRILGKRRDARMPGSIRGICPLSPDVPRRASSLLDQRHLGTPSPSRPVVWKFNTINEAVVHSAQWKEFASKIAHDENENS